jgi:DNA processing protein
MNERAAWVALASVVGVGDVTFARLLERHGSARSALEAVAGCRAATADRAIAEMSGTRPRPGLGRRVRQAAADPGRVPRLVAALGGWLLTPLDPDYPESLHRIEEPPLVLYGQGDRAILRSDRLVAVVGTRRPTAAGRDLTTRVAGRLVEAGATVVSGLAMGIDGAAHRAAVDARAPTVAVAGSGIDRPAPAANRGLARRIVDGGAIVSELAPGVQASRGTFPRRNRIISGLAFATIIIEAPARSGALITARHALEQGRRLLVATGRPLDPRVAGNLQLLRESPARPLIGLDELVADLELDRSTRRQPAADRPAARLSRAGALALLEPTQRTVATALADGPRSIDALCRATALDPGVVSAALTMLQLRGWVHASGAVQLPAGPLARMDK